MGHNLIYVRIISFLNCSLALAEIGRGGMNPNSEVPANFSFLLNDKPGVNSPLFNRAYYSVFRHSKVDRGVAREVGKNE